MIILHRPEVKGIHYFNLKISGDRGQANAHDGVLFILQRWTKVQNNTANLAGNQLDPSLRHGGFVAAAELAAHGLDAAHRREILSHVHHLLSHPHLLLHHPLNRRAPALRVHPPELVAAPPQVLLLPLVVPAAVSAAPLLLHVHLAVFEHLLLPHLLLASLAGLLLIDGDGGVQGGGGDGQGKGEGEG